MMGGFIITSYARVECASVRRFGVTTQGTGGCSYVGLFVLVHESYHTIVSDDITLASRARARGAI